jgi:Zn finger protein HypA/HybF involved in hydrogenase expression
VENVSRRRVLESSVAVLGSISVTDSHRLLQSFDSTIEGWVTKGDQTAIAGEKAVIESFRHIGSSLCNDGKVYECRTCAGVEFYLLVPSDSSQPTVDATYRFSPTGRENGCENFQVELSGASSCESAESTTTTEDPAEATTTETTTETTTTETTTEESSDTTTETTTEKSSDTTTETTTETPDSTTTTTEEQADANPTERPTDD